LGEALASIKSVWRHRKGYEIPASILDTIDVIWPEGKPRPLLTHKKQTPGGWHIIFTLMPGVSFNEFKNKTEFFSDACRGLVDIKKVNGFAHVNISTGSMEKFYPYSFNTADYPKLDLPIPVGYDSAGNLEIFDLAESPHLLIAGVPGFGKSNFLHVLIHSLLPKALIAIIDPKRLEFSYLKNHCALAKNESEGRAMARSLNKEMERRIDLFEDAGCVKIQDYKGELPRIILVIDEVAEIEDEQTIYYIDRIVRLARAVGISVVAATQRPSKKLKIFKDDTRDMFLARLCYQMADEISSRMVLGEQCPQAAYLPEIKGRGIFKYGMTIKEVQSMCLSLKEAKKILKGTDKVVSDFAESCTIKRLPPR
jgi:S-DNA-T family DNA segregation ATPase FtsK/SpoIIIE